MAGTGARSAPLERVSPASVPQEGDAPKADPRRRVLPSAVVLCYHHIYSGRFEGYNVTPAQFGEHLKLLSERGYRTIGLADLQALVEGRAAPEFPGRAVLLTFDDGSRSLLTHVAPQLRRYGMRGVVFLYPAIIGSARYRDYLRSWREVRALQGTGLFEFGSHSLTHPQLHRLTSKQLDRELRESRRILEKRLGRSIVAIAYPFGRHSPRVVAAARRAGYRLAFTAQGGPVGPGTDVMRIPRTVMRLHHGPTELEKVLNRVASP